MELFEQVTYEKRSSDGEAVFFTLMHQFVATPGTFVLCVLLPAVFAGRPGVAHSILRANTILMISLCAALAIGYGAGRFSPHRAHFGYWVWLLPTISLVVRPLVALFLYRSAFAGTDNNYFRPDEYFYFVQWSWLTVPWLQSFFYSFGLRLAVGSGLRRRPRSRVACAAPVS